MDGNRQISRWFLSITLNYSHNDIHRIKTALEFENQRKPAHFKVDELKHELFMARKNKAADLEIERIKKEIAIEKKHYPGKHRKAYFRDRPVVFFNPDQLRMELTHITPGKKKLKQLLAQHTPFISDQHQSFEIGKPLTEAEFQSLLSDLLGRDEYVEAIKLVKLQMKLNTTEAKSYIENNRQ